MAGEVFNPDIKSAAAALIRKAGEPLSVEEIEQALPDSRKINSSILHKLIADLCESEEAFKWPKTRNKIKYWHTPFDSWADRIFTELLADKALMRSEIDGALKKALFGVSAAKVTDLRRRLIKKHQSSGKLFEHPVKPPQRKRRLSFQPPDPSLYLSKVEKEIGEVCKKLNKAGVDSEKVFRAIVQTIGPRFAAPAEIETIYGETDDEKKPCAADMIYNAIFDVEPRAVQLAPVSIPRLRQAVQIGKQMFDRAVFELAENGTIFLQRHAHPAQMNEEERYSMVTDGQGDYYAGLVLRKGRKR